jgi:ectoine hydroxylase-related dioxygenase (phytanoyl-CoA dioxygenase family)
MLSVAVALEPATRENGCMQLLRGSHKLGRIEHGRVAGQTGADPERVEQALKRLELVHCEMGPGDALFFHSNTLHCSAANLSERSRNLLICCYNKATNDPYKPAPPPGLHAAPEGAGRGGAGGRAPARRRGARWFLEEGKDETTEARRAG